MRPIPAPRIGDSHGLLRAIDSRGRLRTDEFVTEFKLEELFPPDLENALGRMRHFISYARAAGLVKEDRGVVELTEIGKRYIKAGDDEHVYDVSPQQAEWLRRQLREKHMTDSIYHGMAIGLSLLASVAPATRVSTLDFGRSLAYLGRAGWDNENTFQIQGERYVQLLVDTELIDGERKLTPTGEEVRGELTLPVHMSLYDIAVQINPGGAPAIDAAAAAEWSVAAPVAEEAASSPADDVAPDDEAEDDDEDTGYETVVAPAARGGGGVPSASTPPPGATGSSTPPPSEPAASSEPGDTIATPPAPSSAPPAVVSSASTGPPAGVPGASSAPPETSSAPPAGVPGVSAAPLGSSAPPSGVPQPSAAPPSGEAAPPAMSPAASSSPPDDAATSSPSSGLTSGDPLDAGPPRDLWETASPADATDPGHTSGDPLAGPRAVPGFVGGPPTDALGATAEQAARAVAPAAAETLGAAADEAARSAAPAAGEALGAAAREGLAGGVPGGEGVAGAAGAVADEIARGAAPDAGEALGAAAREGLAGGVAGGEGVAGAAAEQAARSAVPAAGEALGAVAREGLAGSVPGGAGVAAAEPAAGAAAPAAAEALGAAALAGARVAGADDVVVAPADAAGAGAVAAPPGVVAPADAAAADGVAAPPGVVAPADAAVAAPVVPSGARAPAESAAPPTPVARISPAQAAFGGLPGMPSSGGLRGDSGAFVDPAAIRAAAENAGLRLPDPVYANVAAALGGGKHLVLVGAPGAGKTALALAIARAAAQIGRANGATLITARHRWTDQELLIAAGKSGRWVLVDDLDRARLDRALGELSSFLAGLPVLLPDGEEAQPDPNWRIVATAATTPRASQALLRRFAVVEVPPPPGHVLVQALHHAARGDATAAAAIARLLPLAEIAPLGAGVFLDAARHAAARRAASDADEPTLAREAFTAYIAPLLGDLDDDHARRVRDLLGDA